MDWLQAHSLPLLRFSSPLRHALSRVRDRNPRRCRLAPPSPIAAPAGSPNDDPTNVKQFLSLSHDATQHARLVDKVGRASISGGMAQWRGTRASRICRPPHPFTPETRSRPVAEQEACYASCASCL